MPTLTFAQILQTVTVASTDDGQCFTDLTRISAIHQLLEGSRYMLLHSDPLFLLYAQGPVVGREVVLVSSHIDSVYSKCFCHEYGDRYHGTFDNSLTNAALIYDMLAGALPTDVCVAFTGDEEKNSQGARRLMTWLEDRNCAVRFALVTDVTNEGWNDHAPFTLENDLCIDLFTSFRIVHSLDSYLYTFIHQAEPDESWDYAEAGIPSITLCIPVHGDMHSDEGVMVRKSAIPVYCEVLSLLSGIVLS